MSGSDFKPEDSRDRICTIFFDISVQRQDIGGPLTHFYLNLILNRLQGPGKRKKRVLVICNDFASYGAPPRSNAPSVSQEPSVSSCGWLSRTSVSSPPNIPAHSRHSSPMQAYAFS